MEINSFLRLILRLDEPRALPCRPSLRCRIGPIHGEVPHLGPAGANLKPTVDLRGTLKYLGLRTIPFVSRTWVLHRASGLRFRVHVRDAVGRTILRHQSYEPQLTDWLLGALSQGRAGLFVDVGANLGWFALHAARHPRVERVLAVEPDAGNLALLQANIEHNGLRGRIDAIGCALGAEAGTAQLHRYKPSNRGRHSMVMDHGRGGSTVPVRRLDELLEAHGLSELPIAAMKVDVEGYEPLVLAGGRQALSRTQILLMEFSPDLSRAGGLDLAGTVGVIEAEGFRPRTWDGGGTLPSFADLREGNSQVTVGFSRWVR